MRILNRTYKALLLISVCSIANIAQINPDQFQPAVKDIKLFDVVSVAREGIKVSSNNEQAKKAANYFDYLLNEGSIESGNKKGFEISFKIDDNVSKYKNAQHYRITPMKNSVEVKSPSTLGLLYGAVTLSEMFMKEDNHYKVSLCEVDDYPLYQRRIFSAAVNERNVESLLDFALKNKIETIAMASRVFPWYKISGEYLSLLKKIKTWKDTYGGPNVMQMHNIYEEKDIIISSDEDINSLKEVIKISCEHGVNKTMICADDTPPFIYGEGYVLTDENDKKIFKHMADAHSYLMNELHDWSLANNLENELYYVPPFYTYEDMYYGEMQLYKNTPWEDDAFKPLIRDLEFLGNNLSEEVYIVWTGPFVRSRTITDEDLLDWTYNLKGATPFLWDNTMYSHHPFSSTPMFTAWDNKLPLEFWKTTAGNGMFLNGNLAQEDTKVSAITANDYMWNPEDYDPKASLERAMLNTYGKELYELISEYKECELALRKLIGERQLWYDSDTLWTKIRKAKNITTKNPFYYHFNYTRMKALRLQLKGSVPEPVSMEDFKINYLMMDKKRRETIEKITSLDAVLGDQLRGLSMELPDFNTIQ